MSINLHAKRTPDKAAVKVVETGAVLTYAQLEDASARLARVLRERGAKPGDRIAVLMDNRAEYFVAVWAARRCGLRFVPVNWHLKSEEAAYVVDNSDAVALITSQPLLGLAETVRAQAPQLRTLLTFGPAHGAFEAVEAATKGAEPWPLTDEPEGAMMPYSSGTSGRPKGILRNLGGGRFGERIGFEIMVEAAYGFGPDTLYLCPAPLYHTAPLGWTMATQANGGTVILLESFDAERALQAIERHRVSHAQFVPTHFIRMLKLPEATRRSYDLSSLKIAIHAAAPCPVDVKQAIIDWWGPIVFEYYAGSEGGGFVSLDTAEWLAHRGSVGKVQDSAALAMGAGPGGDSGVHIVDPETGQEVEPGEVGVIYFAGAAPFEYHKDPGKTAEFFNDKGWGTLGDMGWIDPDGYLYLTDRKSHMIISGGVNIYPQEIESVLALHSAVADVAVIGVPNAEFGEEVKAVVQPAVPPSEDLGSELIAYCRERLAGFKCPRTVDFVEALPRLPNGKLLKRELRKTYWPENRAQI